MKFIIASLALIAVASAQPVEQQAIAILRQSQDVGPDGSYNYNFETENGIDVSQSGQLGAVNEDGDASVVSQGQYRYTAPDGTPISVTYVADENGYRAEGAHLPQPPPVPEAILRSLQYNAAHPEEDDQTKYQQRQQEYNRRF